MKILFLSRILFLSGVTTHMRDLAAELIKRGHSVTIVTAGKKFEHHVGMDQLYNSLIATGVQIHIIKYPNSKKNILSFIRQTFMTYKYIKKEKFDIIHVHTPSLSYIPKLFHLKFVTTIHASSLNVGILQQKPDYLIAISKKVYDDSITWGMNPERIALIYNGVNPSFSKLATPERIRELKQKHNIPLDKTVIGFVGYFAKIKGLDFLINSCNMLKDEKIDNFHLILLGNINDDKDRQWIENIIQQSTIKENLTIFDYDEPKEYYDMFDIFVLPSRSEGFGLVSIEAMLSGNCVVRSNTGGTHEQINDKETGYIFENGNVNQLSDILKFLITHPDDRKKAALAGREKALHEFTSDVMTDKTLDVYQRLIDLKRM